MKPRLIILSDLWGSLKNEWLESYYFFLKESYEVKYYDCRILAELNLEITSEPELHKAFVNGGITKAVSNLITKETKPCKILAFSIGGTIAWKAALKGLKVDQIHAISATRLRYEKLVPDCKVQLYFGEHDLYKPEHEWFESLGITPVIIENKGHLIYKEPKEIESVCNNLLLK